MQSQLFSGLRDKTMPSFAYECIFIGGEVKEQVRYLNQEKFALKRHKINANLTKFKKKLSKLNIDIEIEPRNSQSSQNFNQID